MRLPCTFYLNSSDWGNRAGAMLEGHVIGFNRVTGMTSAEAIIEGPDGFLVATPIANVKMTQAVVEVITTKVETTTKGK